jgi:hypothetical protein
MRFERQRAIPIVYKGVHVDCGYRIDIVVDGRILLELKSVERLLPIHEAQVITYLRLANLPVGLLVNFNVSVLRTGLRRLTREHPKTFRPPALPVNHKPCDDVPGTDEANRMSELYRAFCVFRRLESEVVVYRLFERLSDHQFFVQSADRVRSAEIPAILGQHETQFWELLLESSPDERSQPRSSIQEAIAAFDESFSNEF